MKWHSLGFWFASLWWLITELLKCLLAIYISSEKCLFKSSSPLSIFKLVLVFSLLNYKNFLFWIQIPYCIYDLHIFSPIQWLVFHFLDGNLWNTTTFNFVEVQFMSFLSHCLYSRFSRSHKFCHVMCNPWSQDLFLFFLSFIVLVLIFRLWSILSFFNMVWSKYSASFFWVWVSSSSTIYWKDFSFPCWIVLVFYLL